MILRRRRAPLVAGATALGLACAATAGADPMTLDVHGLLDVTASSRGPGLEMNYFNAGATSFDAYRLRLFFEGAVTPRVQAYTQLVLDEVNTHPVYGAYVMVTPWPGRDAHLLAGKIPWMIGTYGPRTYSDKKPLIGTPLIYQYHTTLRGDAIPPTADALVSQAGRGQYGVIYGSAASRFRGMPVVYDFCWDAGVAVQGSAAPVEYALAVTNGTPSMMMPSQDWNEGKSVMGRLGLQPLPMLRAGVSGSYGPYLASALDPLLPAGRSANHYMQRLYMADFSFENGQVDLKSEGYLNRWMTPTLGDLDVGGYYAEGRLGLFSGAWAAARWESMRFSDLTTSTGQVTPWNYDVDRLETGLGYRLARGAVVKAVYQLNRIHEDDGLDRAELWAMQMSVRF